MRARRFLAWIVTVVLLLTSFVLPAPYDAAREAEALSLEDPLPAEGGILKDTVTSGKCGSSLKWSYDPSTKALTIAGSGRMYDYGPNFKNPWVVNGFASQVKTVSLPKGMTYIGAHAFYSLRAVSFFSIPANVTAIGEGAFEQCAGLKSIAIPKKVTRVDPLAFTGCSALAKVFYEGTQAQRSLISIGGSNAPFTNATWYYEVSDNLAFKSQPKDVKANEGKTVTFKVKTVGATTIQWQFQRPGNSTWYNISGANSEVYSFTAAASNNDYIYRCRIANPITTLFSTPAKLLVKLAVKTQPKSVKVDLGQTATFTVNVTGATKLQWQCQRPGEVSWTNLAGATTTSYSVSTTTSHNGYSYRCAASNNSATVYSKAAKLTVKYVPLAFKTQPKTVKVDEGKKAAFKVKVTGANTLQWQYQKPGATVWYDLSDATSNTYAFEPTLAYDGYYFRCRASGPLGTIYSDPAQLMIKISIKKQPKAVTIYANQTTSFSVEATGASSLQWQYQKPGETVWYNLSGATFSTYSLTATTAKDGYVYRCRLSNRTSTVYSKAVKLKVKIIKITVKTNPQSVALDIGETAAFSVKASGAANYQWQYRRSGETTWYNLSGATSPSYSLTAAQSYNGYAFRCKLSNPTITVYSNIATLTVFKASRYRAVLVGESNYRSNPLPSSVNDMNSMAGMLRGLKHPYTTTTLPNSTKKQVMDAISSSFASATEDDVSLFFYAGHGAGPEVPTDANPNDPYLGALYTVDSKYIQLSELASALSNVKGRVIVILCSCFSGAAIGKSAEDAEAQLQAFNNAVIDAFSAYDTEAGQPQLGAKFADLARSKFVVLTGTTYNEFGWATTSNVGYDGSSYPQARFAAALIKGMGCKYPKGASSSSSMPADTDKDGRVTVYELYKYSYTQTLKWGSRGKYQHVQYYGNSSEYLFRRK